VIVALAHAHSEPVERVAALLATTPARGLATAEVRRRRDVYGANLLDPTAPPSRLALLFDQVANLPCAMLLGSTAVSLALGDVVEAGAIVLVLGLNAAIGYRVERRSEDLLQAWRVAELGHAEVVRDGSIVTVGAGELVPGDVLVVRAGTVIAADARVVEAHRLAADEATLTGESEPVDKTSDATAADVPLADRCSMLYRGTSVASGHGRAIVVATGGTTELARVQQLAATAEAPKANLQRRFASLAARLAWASIAAAGASAAAALAWRRPVLEIARDSVALAVAAIPEGLPVTATAALVRAMARMREHGIVVRRLATAETLGGITTLCADKTGTLTENRMRLESVSILDRGRVRRVAAHEFQPSGSEPSGEEPVRGGSRSTASPDGPLGALLVAAVLNSDVDYQPNGGGGLELAGSSTERALVEAAQRAGIDPLAARARWPRRRLHERTPTVRYVVSEHDERLAFVKGAPEQVVPLCALDEPTHDAVLVDNAALAADGLRVLAVAWRRGGGTWRYLGLVALRDPIRDGAAYAVAAAARAGIRTVIVTGDQRVTAEAIARRAGLRGDVIEGGQLGALLASPGAARRLRELAVVARVAPADKVAVVQALRRAGEIVAMAGDGVNDAPALRAADVGIAVGARSTDLARQTADVVLQRDDLRSILAAIAEGRAVQDNLRRSIRFQAAGNLGEILLALVAALAGRRLISSLGILWINLLTDTLPGLALAIEASSVDELDRPPAPPRAPILDRGDWRRVARDGCAIAAASGLAAIAGGPRAAFAAIGATQFGYAATCRAPDAPNTARFAAIVGGSAALHALAAIGTPARRLFRLGGGGAIAAASFAIAMGAPLYVAWRRRATREIVRTPIAAARTQCEAT
jgi:Ca2+-transporting ATPase